MLCLLLALAAPIAILLPALLPVGLFLFEPAGLIALLVSLVVGPVHGSFAL